MFLLSSILDTFPNSAPGELQGKRGIYCEVAKRLEADWQLQYPHKHDLPLNPLLTSPSFQLVSMIFLYLAVRTYGYEGLKK